MSEHNYFGLAAKVAINKRPEDFIVNVAEVEAKCAKTRKERAVLNQPEAVPARVEYNKLRQTLFNLIAEAKNTEIRTTHQTAEVRHIETVISDLLRNKKVSTAELRLGDERSYEHRLVVAESELKAAREALVDWQRANSAAARNLANFDGKARLAELQTELGL